MKINYITLTNIGPYLGSNTYNFQTTDTNNIILIGGKNGTGKTTLLNSIKYGLFGSFSLGLKTDTSVYYKRIESLLNIFTKDTNFSIEICISVLDGYSVDDYIIIRSWKKTTKSLEENVSIKKNDTLLNNDEKIIFLDRLRYISSPELIDSFIYDGEFISSISNDQELSEFIKNTFSSIFSINMLNEINKDVSSYLITNLKEKKLDNNTTETINLTREVNDLKSNIQTLEKSKTDLFEMKNSLSVKQIDLELQFFNRGGIDREKQKELKSRFTEISNQNESIQKSIKYFIENDLSLALCKKLLIEAHQQIRDEKPILLYENLKVIERFLGVKDTDLNKKLQSFINGNKIIHNVTDDYCDKLVTRTGQVALSLTDAINNINKKSDFKEFSTDFKDVLLKNEQVEYLKDLYEEIQKIQLQIKVIDDQLFDIVRKIDDLTKELNIKFNQLENQRNLVKKNNTKENGFALATRFLEINEKYINAKQIMKLKLVSDECKKIFNQAIRKKDYIKEIKIDSNFKIELKDKNKNIIKFTMLSAGEKQLLISSIIWSFFKVSNRNEMFIFDTPVARLDKDNRKNFMEYIVKTIGKQVVILSTNSEIIEECYGCIKTNIAKEYTIIYNDNTKNSEITNGYFGGDK
ncbi:MAG: DNA sulfur modification protein DndD [bacterium]